MTGKKQVDLAKLHMSEREFDRIMGKALKVAAPPDNKSKASAKKKKVRKKKTKR